MQKLCLSLRYACLFSECYSEPGHTTLLWVVKNVTSVCQVLNLTFECVPPTQHCLTWQRRTLFNRCCFLVDILRVWYYSGLHNREFSSMSYWGLRMFDTTELLGGECSNSVISRWVRWDIFLNIWLFLYINWLRPNHYYYTNLTILRVLKIHLHIKTNSSAYKTKGNE